MRDPEPLRSSCRCEAAGHDPALVVITGGPGAGKTAVLEMARRSLCDHVLVLPESAGIVFGGGFPRRGSDHARRAAQRAIFRVQQQLEWLHLQEQDVAVLLCDRGTLDGLAYWPGAVEELLGDVGVDLAEELARYRAVIHLRTPSADHGYNNANPLRTEDADQAAAVDARIEAVWADHPRRTLVDADRDFLAKADEALHAIWRELPPCCRFVADDGPD